MGMSKSEVYFYWRISKEGLRLHLLIIGGLLFYSAFVSDEIHNRQSPACPVREIRYIPSSFKGASFFEQYPNQPILNKIF